MSVGQAEFTPLVEVTFKTRFWRAIRIDNGVRGAARFFVNAARSMASLAADVHGIFRFGVQSGVSGRWKAAVNFCMAFAAGRGANELSPRNFRRSNHSTVECAAGKQGARNNRGQAKEHWFPWITSLG
jgi:hypothetical protein